MAYNQVLAIYEELAREDPEKTRWQQSLPLGNDSIILVPTCLEAMRPKVEVLAVESYDGPAAGFVLSILRRVGTLSLSKFSRIHWADFMRLICRSRATAAASVECGSRQTSRQGPCL